MLHLALKLEAIPPFIFLLCNILSVLLLTGGERGDETALAAARAADPHPQLPEPHPGEPPAHQQGAPESKKLHPALMWRLSSR